ncbi:hypothetical protein A3B45_05575 [Candidatus Daviesbacteria bacterium RIFCSPLOWO2_01_FULL_39_12]|uniref:PIN domain-containing protein n=1 Tax=Candidatus Daviesbacteria bacterium RIFCSPLOWO2_01_FULL_39_12 TaxID=1797785 RepID=A0A1F5KPM9_9BACT|nr:MAG: hypothetical protein A3B45_05575 [Candidatus Daviesbacteria bacterium RIFCSPLOWO2_01_FULL_39_12]
MILLDTNTLLWWICVPQKLSRKTKKLIDQASKEQILVSSISVWEISLLIKKERVGFFIDADHWLEQVESLPFIRFVPLDNKIAVQSVNLPDFSHKDPADRMIIATAREYGAILITSDKKILNYEYVRTVSIN